MALVFKAGLGSGHRVIDLAAVALLGLGVVVMDLGRRARRADRARVLSRYVAGSSLCLVLGLGFVLVGLTVGRPAP